MQTWVNLGSEVWYNFFVILIEIIGYWVGDFGCTDQHHAKIRQCGHGSRDERMWKAYVSREVEKKWNWTQWVQWVEYCDTFTHLKWRWCKGRDGCEFCKWDGWEGIGGIELTAEPIAKTHVVACEPWFICVTERIVSVVCEDTQELNERCVECFWVLGRVLVSFMEYSFHGGVTVGIGVRVCNFMSRLIDSANSD